MEVKLRTILQVNHHLKISFSLFIFFLFTIGFSHAQITLSSGTPSNTQNFNGMGAGLTLPTDWRMAANVANPDYTLGATAVTQQAPSGSPTTGGTYNWGAGVADRCAGVMTSGSFASPNSLMANYQNTDATQDLVSLAITYKLERYRINTAAASVQFFYSLDGTTWIAATLGDVAPASLPTGGSAYSFAPMNTINVSFSLTGLNIPPSANFYLRWNFNTTGSNSQGIGVDDVGVTATFCNLANINTQPIDASICPNANALFSVVASGVSSYQWQYYNGASWVNLTNTGVYTNVTTATMNLTTVPVAMNGTLYRCIVRGPGCPATSDAITNVVTLRVGDLFSITTQPANTTVCYGTNTSLNVVTSAGASFFQWQVSTDGGVTFNNVINSPPFSNATTATLNITNPSTGLTGTQYQCVISNGGCAAPDPTITTIATLTVNGPVFVVNPGNSGVCVGANTSFTVVATGASPTYQWQVSTNSGGTWTNLTNVAPYSNVTTASMNITAAVIGMNAYQYRCVVTVAGCPGQSTAALLTVSSQPVIFTQPTNVVTPAGTNALFSVNATNVNASPPNYQWQESTDNGATWNNIVDGGIYSGSGTAALSLSPVNAGMDTYQYRCILTGCGAGVTTTNAATLFISVTGGTIFAPGDLVFVGFDSYMGGCGGYDNGDDKYYITNMVDILPGTKFKIVNSRFESGAAANVRTNRWYGPGNDPYQDPAYISLTWFGALIPRGSIICVTSANPAPYYAYGIRVNGTLTSSFDTTGSRGSCNLSQSDPDQLYIVQGDFVGFGSYNTTRYNILSGKVLFGMTNGVNWVPFTSPCNNANAGGSARQSRLPDDIECFNLQFTTNTKATYYPNSASHNGSVRQNLGNIFNLALWQYPTSTTCLNITEDWNYVAMTALATGRRFTFVAGNPAGYWVGDADVNWFNCRNWETYTVPDPTVDVVIPVAGVGAFDCVVDTVTYLTTSRKYSNLAQCKTLTVSGRNLIPSKSASLICYGNFLLTGSGQLNMNDGTAAFGTFSLLGNWTNNRTQAEFIEGDGIVNFLSSSSITINNSGGLESFYKIISSKTGSATITMNANVDVVNSIALNGGVWDLNSKRMEIFNPLAAGITRTADYIQSETNVAVNPSIVKWNMGVSTGAHIFAFGASGDYLPFTFDKTSAVTADITVATRATTTSNNQPWDGLTNVAAVANMYSGAIGGDGSVPVTIDRWWDVLSSTASTTANMTFTYRGAENTLAAAYQNSALSAQNWNGILWMPPVCSACNNGVTTGTGTVGVSGQAIDNEPWVLTAQIAPLPVELLTFNAKAIGNKQVDLKWTTASEKNNDYFTVLRSKDGYSYTAIGKVKGNGTTSTVSNYHYTDNTPLSGTSFYKLTQTDYNTNTSESKVCAVTLYTTGNYGISSYYANEGVLQFILTGSDQMGNVLIELHDVTGRVIYSATDFSADKEKQISIDTHGLDRAVYFLRVSGKGGVANLKVKL